MNKKIKKNLELKNYVTCIGVFSLIILSGIFLTEKYNILLSILLMLDALVSYFYISYKIAGKNWFDLRAVFSGVWLFTMGLATFRLTAYQEPWQLKTWILLTIGYILFEAGAYLGVNYGYILWEKLCNKVKRIEFKKCYFKHEPDRYFPICVTVTIIGLIFFIINVWIKGFIPCFVDNEYAYLEFYTRFHVFAVAATSVSGLCYYTLKTQKLSIWKKCILYLCIIYLVFVFPIMVVSRGVFVVVALSLSVTFFYLNKKRFLSLVLCIVTILGIYQITSSLRNYTDGQLEQFFEPKEISMNVDGDNVEETPAEEDTIPTEEIPVEENTTLTEEVPVEENTTLTEDSAIGQNNVFVLSPKMSFIYGYLTVSHDNFNEAVKNLKGYTWGCRQLYPFNVILRNNKITEIIEQGEYYQVNPYLNTTNMLGIFYYDLHEIGVVLGILFWSFIIGSVQGIYEKEKSVFQLLILGHVMVLPTLSFFSAWVDKFEMWMFCGTVIIVDIFASFHRKQGN